MSVWINQLEAYDGQLIDIHVEPGLEWPLRGLPASFSGAIKGNISTEILLPSIDPRGCGEWTEESSVYLDKIVLILRGDCSFTEKARYAQAAGAAMAMIYNLSLIHI